MSADTTVVIAAYRHPGHSELAYTAEVVQAVENLTAPLRQDWALETAKAIFLNQPRQWFHGKGALGRAKQFANLLAQETRVNGILEYEDRPMIEIGVDGVYLLSRKGNRKETSHDDNWMADMDADDEFNRGMDDYVHRGPDSGRALVFRNGQRFGPFPYQSGQSVQYTLPDRTKG